MATRVAISRTGYNTFPRIENEPREEEIGNNEAKTEKEKKQQKEEEERQKKEEERQKKEEERDQRERNTFYLLCFLTFFLAVGFVWIISLQQQVYTLQHNDQAIRVLIGHPDDVPREPSRRPRPTGVPIDGPTGGPNDGPTGGPGGPTGGPGGSGGPNGPDDDDGHGDDHDHGDDHGGGEPGGGGPDDGGEPGPDERPNGRGAPWVGLSIFSILSILKLRIEELFAMDKSFGGQLQGTFTHPPPLVSFVHNAVNQDWQHFPTNLSVDSWFCTVSRDVRVTPSADPMSSTACAAENINGTYFVSVLAGGAFSLRFSHQVSVECKVDCMSRVIVLPTWGDKPSAAKTPKIPAQTKLPAKTQR